MDLTKLNLKQAREGLRKKEFSSVELTNAFLQRIKEVEPKISAFVTITGKEALEMAEKADKLISDGQELPLLGVPISIKDNFCTNEMRTTASSKVLNDFMPPYDATVVSKLKNAGMVLLGKTNMDAWAHGSSTETSDFGSSKNPWNIDYLPGGSSGGAAASVAGDEAIFGLGSETAGSIRQPASWCGVVGLKPTYGRVSRYGVIAMGSSLDCPGPITKSVEDAAIILEILAGRDVFDATSSPREIEKYSAALNKSIKGLKIGVCDDYFDSVDVQVVASVKNALKVFEGMGAEIINVKLFEPKYAIAVYTIIQRAEVSSNLARYDGVRFGDGRGAFGEEAKRRIMLGTYVLSAGYYDQFYNKASKVRTVIIDDFKKAFQSVDLIIAPTSPSTALPLGSSKNYPMFGEMADILVEPSSIAGLPGINVPCGFSSGGLPIGLQIIGPQFSESKILNAGFQYEQSTKWKEQKPKI